EEGHVGPQARCDGEERALSDRTRRQGVERAKDGAGIRAPATEPSSDRDSLPESDGEAGGPTRRTRVFECGAPREVALDGTELSRIDLAGHVERPRPVGGAHGHVIGKGESEEQRLEL